MKCRSRAPRCCKALEELIDEYLAFQRSRPDLPQGKLIDLSEEELSIRGKGDKVRVVFLSDTAKIAVKKYLNKRVDVETL